MAGMTAFVGNELDTETKEQAKAQDILDSIHRLVGWLDRNQYQGYDTFDGLSAPYLRPLTFNNNYLLIALQQGVRRFPLNMRPMLGIKKGYSSKGMGYLARGFLRLYGATGDSEWSTRAEHCLNWLMDNPSPGYSGACWGNHFDYVSRNGRIPKGMPTVVWTSLIGHAFLDGYDRLQKDEYLSVAVSICEHIRRDLRTYVDGDSLCINYTPGADAWVHNANVLGGSILARTYALTKDESLRELAQKAMAYTAKYQRSNGSWFYGEKSNLHWVDNFHTGYVLDCFRYYVDSTGDHQFDDAIRNGYEFWKQTFFLTDGTPRYYDKKTLPLDIQCASQGIDTLICFSKQDSEALGVAVKVAQWAIANMQDSEGYFYYRRYSPYLVNKTPTLHWGQATMLCALGGLYKELESPARSL